MRFLMTMNGGGRPADQQLYAEMGRVRGGAVTKAGVLLATGGLDAGTHISATDGQVTLTDGPYAEAKETIVSFALIEVRIEGGGDRAVPSGSGRSSGTARATSARCSARETLTG